MSDVATAPDQPNPYKHFDPEVIGHLLPIGI
jgi:hypothetical protein